LVNQTCISAKECEARYYVSFYDDSCVPCEIGMDSCYFDFIQWRVVATGCMTNFVLNEYQHCVVSNHDLF